jgi:hypothetical protein
MLQSHLRSEATMNSLGRRHGPTKSNIGGKFGSALQIGSSRDLQLPRKAVEKGGYTTPILHCTSVCDQLAETEPQLRNRRSMHRAAPPN